MKPSDSELYFLGWSLLPIQFLLCFSVCIDLIRLHHSIFVDFVCPNMFLFLPYCPIYCCIAVIIQDDDSYFCCLHSFFNFNFMNLSILSLFPLLFGQLSQECINFAYFFKKTTLQFSDLMFFQFCLCIPNYFFLQILGLPYFVFVGPLVAQLDHLSPTFAIC